MADSAKAISGKDTAALFSGPAYAADYGTSLKALQYAGAANNPASIGIVANVKKREKKDQKIAFSGNIFFVTDKVQFDDSNGRLEATEYRIAAIELSGLASFIGTDTHFAQVESLMSGFGRRCCGTKNICNPATPSVPGVSNELLPFEPSTSAYGFWDVRLGLGNPTIRFAIYPPGLHNLQTGLPTYIDPAAIPPGFNCIQTHDPICDIGDPGFLLTDDGKPDIPVGSNACGEMTRPVDITKVPDWCTFAHTLDGCNGLFPKDYDQPYAVANPGIDPMCLFATPFSPDDRCGESYAQRLEKKMDFQVATGWTWGRRTKQCTPLGETINDRHYCIECDAEGHCRDRVEKLPWNPIAMGPDQDQEEEWKKMGAYKDDQATYGWGLDITPEKPQSPPPKQETTIPSPKPEKVPFNTDFQTDQLNGRAESLTNKPSPNASYQPAAKASQPKAKDGDPVRLADGSFVITHTDLSFKGPVRNLEFIRSYQSNWGKRSVLGTNWTHNWDVWVQPLNSDNIPDWLSPWCAGATDLITAAFVHDAGVTDLYLLDAATQLYLPQAGAFGTLARTDTNGWALRDPDGSIRVFDQDGDLVSDRDRFGNGFLVTSEPTPLFRLYQAYCTDKLLLARNETKYSRQNHLLAYLVGEAPRPGWRISEWDLDDNYDFLPVPQDVELAYAREYLFYLVSLAKTNHQMIDRIDGFRKKRPLSVTDDTGRKIVFSYYKEANPLRFKFNYTTLQAELLQRVEGPVGTSSNLNIQGLHFTRQKLMRDFLPVQAEKTIQPPYQTSPLLWTVRMNFSMIRIRQLNWRSYRESWIIYIGIIMEHSWAVRIMTNIFAVTSLCLAQ